MKFARNTLMSEQAFIGQQQLHNVSLCILKVIMMVVMAVVLRKLWKDWS